MNIDNTFKEQQDTCISNPSQETPDSRRRPEWKVVYQDGFWPHTGCAGEEVRVDKQFPWGEEIWHIPAVYLCADGLVMDFCVEVEPERVKAYIDKWDLLHAREQDYTEAQREQIQSEHPLNIEFHSDIEVNGLEMRSSCRYGTSWIPEELLPEELLSEQSRTRCRDKWLLEHYGLDSTRAWSVRRVSFAWADERPYKLQSLVLKLEREMAKIRSAAFTAPAVGESIPLLHPAHGTEYLLTVHEYEKKELDQTHFGDADMEYPTHYAAMVYTLYPENQDHFVRDCDSGDSPRRKKQNGTILASSCGVIGIINRGSQKEYRHPDGTPAAPRAVCSSIHFEPVDAVEWVIVFREKQMPDIEEILF